MGHHPLRLSLVSLAVTLVTVACGSSSPQPKGDGSPPPTTAPSPSHRAAATKPTPQSTAVLTIRNFAYKVPANVDPGTAVTVINQDGEAHTVTADAGSAFNDMASPGRSAFSAPTKPGRYPFHCVFHGNMHGMLVVR